MFPFRLLLLLLLPGLLVSCPGKEESPAQQRAARVRSAVYPDSGEMIDLTGGITPKSPRLPLLYAPPRTEVPPEARFSVCYSTPTPGERATQWWDASLTQDKNYKRLEEMKESDQKAIFSGYARGAAAGHLPSMINLGGFYAKGTGISKDIARALFWYGEAAKSDDAFYKRNGIYNIRFTLLHEKSWEECLKAMSEVDAQTASEYKYGEILYQLDQKAKTNDQRRRVFQQLEKFAAEDAKGASLYVMALCYREGRTGVSKNVGKALSYYRQAADRGYKNAQLALGNIYLHGLLQQPRDISQALEWYRKAIIPQEDRDRNEINYRALTALAVHGATSPHHGVTEGEVDEFFRLAAEAEQEPFARYNSLIYQMKKNKRELSEGTLKTLLDESEKMESDSLADPAFAGDVQFYKAAYHALFRGNTSVTTKDIQALSSSPIPCAKTILANCYMTGRGVKKDASQAARLYEKNRNNDPCALYNLGLCYEAGAGVLPDPEKGKKMKREAEKKAPWLTK